MSTAFSQQSWAGNSKNNRRMWPKFELLRDILAVLVTFKFDDDTIKTWALLYPQHFLRYKSMGNISSAQWQVTPKRIVRSGPKSNSSEIWDSMSVLVIYKFEEDPFKTEGAIVSTTLKCR